MPATSIQNINLSTTQARFALMIEPFPRIAKYWNWERRECDPEALNNAMGVMSHGERVMAQFFHSVWTHNNQSFDITEAGSVLDQPERQVIIDWLTNPFWP